VSCDTVLTEAAMVVALVNQNGALGECEEHDNASNPVEVQCLN